MAGIPTPDTVFTLPDRSPVRQDTPAPFNLRDPLPTEVRNRFPRLVRSTHPDAFVLEVERVLVIVKDHRGQIYFTIEGKTRLYWLKTWWRMVFSGGQRATWKYGRTWIKDSRTPAKVRTLS